MSKEREHLKKYYLTKMENLLGENMCLNKNCNQLVTYHEQSIHISK